jgi:hypothetical protein
MSDKESKYDYPVSKFNPLLTTNSSQPFSLDLLSDGTTTHAELTIGYETYVGSGQFVMKQLGYGESKRRKGEARNPELGKLIAVYRALADAKARFELELAVKAPWFRP